MSESQMTRFTRRVKPSMVFGAQHKTLLREHPIVIAVTAGLDLQGDEYGFITREFAGDPDTAMEVVKGLWRSRKPRDWRDVMMRVVVKPEEGCNPDAMSRWVACLCRYLQANPTPDENSLPSRVVRFMLAISETCYLPLHFTEKI